MVLHRSLWSLLFVLGILAWQRRWRWLGETLRQPRRVALFAASALLLSCNWLVYVWAVQNGRVLESSLGYFINPLVNVLLGVAVLRERLRPLQWLAVALAAAGVLWLTWLAGAPPWIALALACSFGFYGLIRKTAPLGALEGLALENLLVAPVVLPALLWWTFQRHGVLLQGPPSLLALLLLGGPLTALPLLLFSAAARRLPLATLGMVQYVSPTLQFAAGRVGLPRTLRHAAPHRLRAHLVGARARQRRRAGAAPAGCIGGRRKEGRRCKCCSAGPQRRLGRGLLSLRPQSPAPPR